jgi:hypothetical protein
MLYVKRMKGEDRKETLTISHASCRDARVLVPCSTLPFSRKHRQNRIKAGFLTYSILCAFPSI